MDIKDNKQLQDAVAQFVNTATSTMQGAADFTGNAVKEGGKIAAQQIPDILHQYVLWGLAYNISIILTGFLIMFIAWHMISYFLSTGKVKIDLLNKEPHYIRSGWGDVPHTFGIVGGWIIAVIGFLMFATNIPETVQIMVAPKVYLIQQAVHLFHS